jgi:5-(aminomethyl)-3-furanmethanol phosphate kinase
MWVVKLGGSLAGDPLLPQWLDLLTQLGGGRITVVAGGGGFADEARRLQAHWQFSELAAHNMAVLAMAQTAYQLQALNPGLQLASREADIRSVLQSGHTAAWLPFELQRDEPDARTNWRHTSDSIALDLAHKLNAERLVVVKSCLIDPGLGLADLCAAGVLDPHFADRSASAAFPINVLHKADLTTMRNLLLDEGRYPAG